MSGAPWAAEGRCGQCGRVPYRSQAVAEKAAEILGERERGHHYASTCGQSWHVKSFRWSGRYRRGARKDHRDRLRADAQWRNDDTDPKRRSTKRRAKRERKSEAAKEGT